MVQVGLMRTDLAVEIVPYAKSGPFRRLCRKRSLDAFLEDWDDIIGKRVDLFLVFLADQWPFGVLLQGGVLSRRGEGNSRGVGVQRHHWGAEGARM